MEKTSKKKSLVFLDVSIDGDPVERMTFELFNDVAPNTAENFRALCTGEKGVSAKSGKPLHYKGTFFHRLIKGHAAQGGDFLRQNGNYGESIYEGNFPDESPKLKHDAPGLLSMAIADRDERGSLFCVTFKADHDLDRKCVVFGKLSDGYEVLKKIENAGNEDGTPDVTVKIINSGELSDADRKRRSKLKILKDTKEGNNPEVKRKMKQKRSSKKRKRRRKYYTSESDSSTDTDSEFSDSDSDSSTSSLSDTSSSSDEKHKKRKRSKRDKHKRGKRKEKRREKRRKRRDRKSKRKSKRGIVSDSDSSSEDDAAVGTLDVKQKILENQFPIVEEQEVATVDHKKRETEDGEFPTQNGNYQSKGNGVEMDSNIRNASGHPGVVDHMRSKSRSRSLSPRRAPSKSMSISPSRNSRSPVTSPQRSSTPSPVTRRPMQVSDTSRSVSPARSISRSPIRSPSRSKNETSISRSPPVRSSRRSLSRSSGRVPPRRSPSPSPVRAPSRKNRHSYSRSPVSPRRRAKSPVSRSLSRSPSVDGSPKRARRGRGFSDRYSYAHRYKSRSPDRSPARSHRYGGRSDRDRYPSYRRSPRRYRSPPRGRTPPRYRPRRSRTRSPSVSRSPIRYRRRYSRSNSPVRSRSPIERYRPNRRRSPSRSRTRSESPLSRRDSQSPKDADKSGNSRSSSGSPPQKTGLVSYGDGSPDSGCD